MPGLQRREIPGVRGTVTNTGARAGTETVQRYVHHVDQPVFRPDQELRAFARVTLDPGQSSTVRLTLGTRAFAYWHDQQHRWHVAPGSYDLRIGASSRDHRLVASITLEGKPLAAPLTSETDAETWLAHPDAGPGSPESSPDRISEPCCSTPTKAECSAPSRSSASPAHPGPASTSPWSTKL